MIGKYWFRKATLGVSVLTHLAEMIPEGDIIEIPVAPLAGNRTVDVLWKGRTMMVFVEDIEDRCESIKRPQVWEQRGTSAYVVTKK
jgi:hypothetical protein